MYQHSPFAASAQSAGRPWLRLVLVGLLAVVAVLAIVVLFQENVSPTQATADDPLNFAEGVITGLVQKETLNRELGSIEADPVQVQLEGTITGIAEQGDSIHQGEALFTIDDQPVVLLYGGLPSLRNITATKD